MKDYEIRQELETLQARIKEVETKGKSEKNNFRRMFIIDELLTLKALYSELEAQL